MPTADRVLAAAREIRERFGGLARSGIDELSYPRGHSYLMVVVDHDTLRLVSANGRATTTPTLQDFFDELGPARAAKIRLISARAVIWVGECANHRVPQRRAAR